MVMLVAPLEVPEVLRVPEDLPVAVAAQPVVLVVLVIPMEAVVVEAVVETMEAPVQPVL
jgi:hypothetical protein